MAERHDIMWFDTLDSTNEEVRRRIGELDNLSVVSALSQTAGRGQRGNTWTSAPGENLTFSILLKFGNGTDSCPTLKATDQFIISEITALAVTELLEKYGISAKIKWPNDIYTDDRKICGILIENSLRGEYINSSIVGIGLNINQKNFDVSLPNPTSFVNILKEQKCFDIVLILEDFVCIFKTLYKRYIGDSSLRKEIREEYLCRLWRLETTSRFKDLTVLPKGHSITPVVTGIDNEGGQEFIGIIKDLTPDGKLIIENIKDNSLKEFSFKEIAYIL